MVNKFVNDKEIIENPGAPISANPEVGGVSEEVELSGAVEIEQLVTDGWKGNTCKEETFS